MYLDDYIPNSNEEKIKHLARGHDIGDPNREQTCNAPIGQ